MLRFRIERTYLKGGPVERGLSFSYSLAVRLNVSSNPLHASRRKALRFRIEPAFPCFTYLGGSLLVPSIHNMHQTYAPVKYLDAIA